MYRSLPTAATRSLVLREVSASVESPTTNATPMLSQRRVTIPPSELIRASPPAGIEAASLKTTTVFPVGIPLAGLNDVLTWPGVFCGAEMLVGSSEHAVIAAMAGTTNTDHRAR